LTFGAVNLADSDGVNATKPANDADFALAR
jgi:hypothetical protein